MDFLYQKLVIGTHHDTFMGFPSPHKTLGYLALAHYLVRYGLFVFTGSMQFSKTNVDLIWIVGHLTLSFSSFLFPIRKTRNFSNQIIWRELQLHNIVFSARSCAILAYSIYYPSATLFRRFFIVMGFHIIADVVTMFFGEGVTMRDMSWDGTILPIEIKPYLDRFYAYSQFGATILLILPTDLTMEHAFMTLFAIQLSTFLMTLRLKGIIRNDMWHILYTASLLTNYHVGMQSNDSYQITLLQVAFYLWRVVLRQPKYLGWFLLFLYYQLYLSLIEIV